MLNHPTVLSRFLRYPVDVLWSERPMLVRWIRIRDLDGSEEMVQYPDDLVCLEGTSAFWRYVAMCDRLQRQSKII